MPRREAGAVTPSRDHGAADLNAAQRALSGVVAHGVPCDGLALRVCDRCGGWADLDHTVEECDGILANRSRPSYDDLRAQLAAVTAERDALRAIVEGRTMPPTPAEIVAHEATGGYFLFRDHDETGRVYDADCLQALLDDAHRHLTRWWAHDANDAPCAWPTVPA